MAAEDLAPEPPTTPPGQPQGGQTETVAASPVDSVAEPPRPQPELVPLLAPDEAEPAADRAARDTIFLDESPADPKRVEAQLFAGDPVAEPRPAADAGTKSPSDLFGRDDDSPLGEPDEQADAAMRAFFERDLDDPSVAGRSRFGRRR